MACMVELILKDSACTDCSIGTIIIIMWLQELEIPKDFLNSLLALHRGLRMQFPESVTLLCATRRRGVTRGGPPRI
jgi:hypothetical protein